jgi:hypothetical protein
VGSATQGLASNARRPQGDGYRKRETRKGTIYGVSFGERFSLLGVRRHVAAFKSADMSAHSKAGAKSFDFSAIGLLWKAFCQTVSRLRN